MNPPHPPRAHGYTRTGGNGDERLNTAAAAAAAATALGPAAHVYLAPLIRAGARCNKWSSYSSSLPALLQERRKMAVSLKERRSRLKD